MEPQSAWDLVTLHQLQALALPEEDRTYEAGEGVIELAAELDALTHPAGTRTAQGTDVSGMRIVGEDLGDLADAYDALDTSFTAMGRREAWELGVPLQLAAEEQIHLPHDPLVATEPHLDPDIRQGDAWELLRPARDAWMESYRAHQVRARQLWRIGQATRVAGAYVASGHGYTSEDGIFAGLATYAALGGDLSRGTTPRRTITVQV